MFLLNPALRDFWITPARIRTLYGGRASSKSHDAAGFAVYLAANYTLRFLCVRQFQNRISESVYTLLKNKIADSEYWNQFEITKTSIRHKGTKSEFFFYGIQRNISEIKSTEAVDVLWIEEGHALTADQWEVIEPTIRAEDSEIWLIFNPDEFTDFAYQNFVVNPPAYSIKREINWPENPFLSKTALRMIYEYYRREPDLALNIYGGQPKMGADKSVINLAYIISAIDAHKKLGWEPMGKRQVGFDVADDGEDNNATVLAHGNVIQAADEWHGLEDELLKSCTKTYNQALESDAQIVWDSIGVGAHAGSKFKELNIERWQKVKYDPFNAGGGVEDPKGVYMQLPHTQILNRDHFANAKAQEWDNVATRFRKTHEMVNGKANHPFDQLISLDSASIGLRMLEKMKLELAAPHKDIDRMGRFQVESKVDMRERGVKSPNIADAFIMALVKPKRSVGFFD